MQRMQLFEFEDQNWFPSIVREAMTDFLSFISSFAEIPFAPFAERLHQAMAETGDDRLIDLASGGGGPALIIARILSRKRTDPVNLTLTDLYPNLPRLELARREGGGFVDFVAEPIDATAVPEVLRGFRLMCNAFHHLSPDAARRCLGDAVGKRQGVALLEFVQRSPGALLQVSVGLAAMLAVTPFIRPHRWSRLLLTYVLPVVPVCTLWDGLVSCMRAYEPSELRELVASLADNDYEWDIGRLPVPRTGAAVTYLIGRPRAA
jgi:hypothetical protein